MFRQRWVIPILASYERAAPATAAKIPQLQRLWHPLSSTSSNKPGDDLIANFRQQFPEVAAVAASSGPPALNTVAAENASLAAPATQQANQGSHHGIFHDQDPTPRATAEQWRFTPSLLDPHNFNFHSHFANQPPGYYTPTPGGTNTLYHPQAGDLHTPTLGLGMGLGTPLSLPISEGAMNAGPAIMDLSQFQPSVPPQQFQQQQFNPFIQPTAPQASFGPSTFVHHDTGYETMDHDGSPLDSDQSEEQMGSLDATFSQSPPMIGLQSHPFGMAINNALPPAAVNFRFHATLNAPTAMVKHADEIPVTYLNKGQAYSLSIKDSSSAGPIAPGTRYRTFVRISFEDDQQRQKPGVCWSLWKEGRGTNEAHQRGGKLQAVEYVEAAQPAEGDEKRTRIEPESAAFDGFSVVWTPGINGSADCSIAVRFNFLSTDFSHSKGVKGIPVRLCAKTSILPPDDSSPRTDATQEICYCKVKLFRDHGAERKLSNDVAHVKKSIDKIKQQIAQAESGLKDFGKRKRGTGSQAKAQDNQRPGKVQKHKRTWSMSSTSSAGGGNTGGPPRAPIDEDLHFKLQVLQDMFTSTRPVSVLYLRGDDLDDPDLHPVSLPGEPTDLTKVEPRDSIAWQARRERNSVAGSSLVSPSPSSMSLQSLASASVGGAQWGDLQGGDRSASRRLSEQAIKVPKNDNDGNLSGWIEALGVDPSYRPPLERRVRPVACFYVARQTPNGGKRELHRAVYLPQRNLADFISGVSAKWGLDPAGVVRAVHVLESGLEVEMDDDVVRELSEGQDMILEIAEVERNIPQPKREWEMAVDVPETHADKDSTCSAFRTATGHELRLRF
ncbi:hypothetical protein DL762_004330 [Monosporascus cannonballus]|uniref:Grh/CP2 DB domain-containing protein n=1 Tax=Monosporascus cannonballus TaxID=155416 RepID=A0ABY0H8J5_9PEZI|nr:hypothetical protein DL762_004330 [Monosporascus cannonballus]